MKDFSGVTLEYLEAIPCQTEENPGGKKPPSPGTLDTAGKRLLWTVYEAAKKHYRKQGERGAQLKQLSARVAWAEVKRHYYKRFSKWQKRKHVLPRAPDSLDLRQRSLPLKPESKSNPRKYRPIKWDIEDRSTKRDGDWLRSIYHTGDGYQIHEVRKIIAGRWRRWFGVGRISFPHERQMEPPPGDATKTGYFKTLTAAKKAANKHRRAYLAAKKKGGSKPKERANPESRNPYGELLDLRARVVELEVELPDGRIQVHTWKKDRPALFWSEKKRAILWVHDGRDPSAFVDGDTRGPVASRHRKWHGTNPTELGELEVPAGPLAKLGPALRIVYFAERYRDGKPRHHDFEAGVGAYAQKSRGARVFECRGGRLTLNDRGLVF